MESTILISIVLFLVLGAVNIALYVMYFKNKLPLSMIGMYTAETVCSMVMGFLIYKITAFYIDTPLMMEQAITIICVGATISRIINFFGRQSVIRSFTKKSNVF